MPLPVNKVLPLTRLVVFGMYISISPVGRLNNVIGAVSLFSLITLALSGHMLDTTIREPSGYVYDFVALALAVSILSLLSLPAMYVLSPRVLHLV